MDFSASSTDCNVVQFKHCDTIFWHEKVCKMETAWRYLTVKKCVKWKPHGDT
jgi:hypothetical protein